MVLSHIWCFNWNDGSSDHMGHFPRNVFGFFPENLVIHLMQRRAAPAPSNCLSIKSLVKFTKTTEPPTRWGQSTLLWHAIAHFISYNLAYDQAASDYGTAVCLYHGACINILSSVTCSVTSQKTSSRYLPKISPSPALVKRNSFQVF